MAFFIKTLNRRWSLFIVKENNSAYVMHGNSVMGIVGFVMGYFANGSQPLPRYCLYLCSNGQKILLGPEHFTSDGEGPTPHLIRQIESIDPRWNGFSGGQIWCEDCATKKDIKISEHAPGKIDVQAMFDNVGKPREVTFFSALDEVFGRN